MGKLFVHCFGCDKFWWVHVVEEICSYHYGTLLIDVNLPNFVVTKQESNGQKHLKLYDNVNRTN
jgi:hypothetical protein